MKRGVFITDGHWRKSLAAVRGLGREGIPVAVGETTRLATAAFSRYCRRRVAYPSPVLDPSRFLEFLEHELTLHQYRMLLPMEEETLALLSEHRNHFSRFTFVPVVPPEPLNLARNKDRTLALAESLGIPVPRTWRIQTLSELREIKESLPYPVVIKPRQGSGAAGVSYPSNSRELQEQYPAAHLRHPYPLIQEMIPREGSGYGASFLFDERGSVRASFVHRRLREYPVAGGASTLRESVKRDDMRDMGERLLKALNWFGVAMVEFKLDPRDGIPKLMEINPRFWGSLSLAVEAGVNFPFLLYRVASGEKFDPVTRYQTGLRCRWLLPGDLLHFLYNPSRRSICKEFFRFRDGTKYDIISREDPCPVLGRLMTPLTFLYDRDMKRRLRERKA